VISGGALTSESVPVAKGTDPVTEEDVPLGDRTCFAYLNTSVTPGRRGEVVVTETGTDTEIGHIVDLLLKTEG
jgi:Ca2+-transporting ATPase